MQQLHVKSLNFHKWNLISQKLLWGPFLFSFFGRVDILLIVLSGKHHNMFFDKSEASTFSKNGYNWISELILVRFQPAVPMFMLLISDFDDLLQNLQLKFCSSNSGCLLIYHEFKLLQWKRGKWTKWLGTSNIVHILTPESD